MRKRLAWSPLPAVAALMVVAGAGLPAAQDAPRAAVPSPQAAPSPSPDPAALQAMMEKALEKYATPGPAHAKLDPMVGRFATTMKTWWMPGAKPHQDRGTTTMAWVLGHRYLELRTDGTFMGKPFKAIGSFGYDNAKQAYVSSWMDTSITSILAMQGAVDSTGKVFTYQGTIPNVVAGGDVPIKAVQTIVDADHLSYEVWGPGPDGSPFKIHEIRYTRIARNK